MSKTIELNGKHYDAVTGVPVKAAVKTMPKVSAVTAPARRSITPKARKLQASRTLMRSTVKKPIGHGPATHNSTKVVPKYVEIPVKSAPTAYGAKKVHANIFEQTAATSTHNRNVHHEVRHHKKKLRNTHIQIGAGLASMLLLAGFAAYQSTPGIQLKVAGFRAGVATAINPNYAAAGFAFHGVHSEGKERVVALSDDGGNQYLLAQQKTAWDDGDLIETLGSRDGSGVPNYTVITDESGLQLYRFNNGTVTWITDGVLNQVDNGSSLSDGQLLSLAANS